MLAEHRGRYIFHLASVVKQATMDHGSCVTELLLQPGERTDPERAFCLYRVDIAAGSSTTPHLIDANVDPVKIGLSLTGFSAPVYVRELAWNEVRVVVQGAEPPIVKIAAWSRIWIDEGDKSLQGPDGFQGVIHSVCRPARSGTEEYVVDVDLGSAPVRALEELLRIVSDGASNVVIGSSQLPQPEA